MSWIRRKGRYIRSRLLEKGMRLSRIGVIFLLCSADSRERGAADVPWIGRSIFNRIRFPTHIHTAINTYVRARGGGHALSVSSLEKHQPYIPGASRGNHTMGDTETSTNTINNVCVATAPEASRHAFWAWHEKLVAVFWRDHRQADHVGNGDNVAVAEPVDHCRREIFLWFLVVIGVLISVVSMLVLALKDEVPMSRAQRVAAIVVGSICASIAGFLLALAPFITVCVFFTHPVDQQIPAGQKTVDLIV